MTEDASRPLPRPLVVFRTVLRRARRLRAIASLRGRGVIARDVVLGARARWLAQGCVEVGPRVFIGADFFLEADLVVGSDTLISSRVAIINDDHPFDSSSLPITAHARRPPGQVVIEGDSLIGHGTVIVGPAVIGRGAIVGAGSLVIGDLPANTVCVGRPARPIKQRRAAADGEQAPWR